MMTAVSGLDNRNLNYAISVCVRFTVIINRKTMKILVVSFLLFCNFASCLESTIMKSFMFSGATEKIVIIPESKYLFVNIFGAEGGDTLDSKGFGGTNVQCLLEVQNDSEFYITIGGKGTQSTGGFNGGKDGVNGGAGGGGSSDIRMGGPGLERRVLVAGGGRGGNEINDHFRENNNRTNLDSRITKEENSNVLGGGGEGGEWTGEGFLSDPFGDSGKSYTVHCRSVAIQDGTNTGNGKATIIFAVAILPYVGSPQAIDLPSNVDLLQVALLGARGGSSITQRGGLGSLVLSNIHISPHQRLFVMIGGAGEDAVDGRNAVGGFNGGGNGSKNSCGGGGASDIHIGVNDEYMRLVVAGGGGGCGWNHGDGGAGGGSIGFPGAGDDVGRGTPTLFESAFSGIDSIDSKNGGGGGGGGYYGGTAGQNGAGGGGGSSIAPLDSSAVFIPDFSAGNGSLLVYFTASSMFSLLETEEKPKTKFGKGQDLKLHVLACVIPEQNSLHNQGKKLQCNPDPVPTPIAAPIINPTFYPTYKPTANPTTAPTLAPTAKPTIIPTPTPTTYPTAKPTMTPTISPTTAPTRFPTVAPTLVPTASPTVAPTLNPTVKPTAAPTRVPTVTPTTTPTQVPTVTPTTTPTRVPTVTPTAAPTLSPTASPTLNPTTNPTTVPTVFPTSRPSSQPSSQPSAQPSAQPTGQPSVQPSGQPTSSPTRQPSAQPSSQPSRQPSCQPSAQPSAQPSSSPTRQPTGQPSVQPSGQPTSSPTRQPSAQPSSQPSRQPSCQPSAQPSAQPSSSPTRQPTGQPSVQPSGQPTSSPTRQPSAQPSSQPSRQPSCQPSAEPSAQPSLLPTCQPTGQPSVQPSGFPTSQPLAYPSGQPSGQPSGRPTGQPTVVPSCQPSSLPTGQPSAQPSSVPSVQPSVQPTVQPSGRPSVQPTALPSSQPSATPTAQPTSFPSDQPSTQPSAEPSRQPSGQPTSRPSDQPTSQPTSSPSGQPSASPSTQPTTVPTVQPSVEPSSQPSASPTSQPSGVPSAQPTIQPSSFPTAQPSTQPSGSPTCQPSSIPSAQPSAQPTSLPSMQPSVQPSADPTGQPTAIPSGQPSGQPTAQPSSSPSIGPSAVPTSCPSMQPSSTPSTQPSKQPSSQPTGDPTGQPSVQPSALPSTQPSGCPSAQPSSQPSSFPTIQPISQPSSHPTAQPSAVPSGFPSSVPSSCPSIQPSSQPTGLPTIKPSAHPSSVPSGCPTVQPSEQPTSVPTTQPTCVPTVQPSFQPVTSPTSLPSGQPTSTPSAQPIGAPTCQPTVSPTVQPTSSPTAQPSTQPTSQPSAQPSYQPSSQPTGTPTAQPRSNPTSQPSGQPSSSPTSKPTAYQSSRTIYSKAPTAVPTQNPTLSELSAWSLKLQDSLLAVTANDTSSVVQRSTYYELDVLSANPTQVYGGCSAWTSLISGNMKAASISKKVTSVQLTAITDLNSADRLQTYESAQTRCIDENIVTEILDALLAVSNERSSSGAIRSVQCNDMTWSIKQCMTSVLFSSVVTYSPAICINCADPCSISSRCASGTSPSDTMLSVSPCVTQKCSSPLAPHTGLRTLSFGFNNIESPPTVQKYSIVAAQNGLQVTAQLSSPGTLYCAVYPTTSTRSSPDSLIAVLLQNHAASTSGLNSTTVVTIPSLDASTSYFIYFLTVSPIGVKATFDHVIASKVMTKTSCCKTITATLSLTSIIENTVVKDALALAFSAPPSQSLRIQVRVIAKNNNNTISNGLFPESFNLGTLINGVYRSSLLPLSIGEYLVQVIIFGTSFEEYSITYGSGSLSFKVISAVTEPPVPVLTHAMFLSDGSALSVKFDSATDRANLETSFICNELFSFACSTTSLCQWSDDSTVTVIIKGKSSNKACAVPGSPLRLLETKAVKAKCSVTSGCSEHYLWKTVVPIELLLLPPITAIVPTVSISAPATIGSCDKLSLDLSGSTGSGGRAWNSDKIVALSSTGVDMTAVNVFLSSLLTLSPPTPIPTDLLKKGQNYNFHVTLCNFLRQCGVGTKSVVVLNDTIPSVQIIGPSVRTMMKKDRLMLTSSAFISTCDGSKSSANLKYTWSVSSEDTAILGLSSVSKDPSKFLLPAHTLAVNSFYEISLTVSALGGDSLASVASIQVFIQPGNIYAVISGGSMRSTRVGDVLVVDATSSYDEDVAGVTGGAAGLNFIWSCTQVSPRYNSSCADIFDTQDMLNQVSLPVLRLVSKASGEGRSCLLSLLVLDALQTRSVSAEVEVIVLPKLAPAVSLTAPRIPATGIINAGTILQLTGTLSVPARQGGNATWMVDDNSVNMLNVATLPVTVSIRPLLTADAFAIASKTFYMALKANSLPAGRTLTFSLIGSIPQSSNRAESTVSVIINSPPTPGSFYIDPVEGEELVVPFHFIATQWVDSDFPLSYQFGYWSTAGISIILKSRSEVSFSSSLLTSGLKKDGYRVNCFAEIFDSLNANISSTFLVNVTKSHDFNTTEMENFIQNSFTNSASDADSILQSVAFSSYLLNNVNCSFAPNCIELHRQPCLTTAHTCGVCESDRYVGEEGDSNEPCFLVEDRRLFLADAFVSSNIEKTCSANCSNHGECEHVYRDSGLPLSDSSQCIQGSVECDSVCLCYDGYAGDICEFTTEDFQQRQRSRSAVINGVQSLVGLEDPDEQVVTGWVNGLALASQASSELTEDTALVVLSLADSIAGSTASRTGSSVDSARVLLSAVNSVSRSSTNSAKHRRLQEYRSLSQSNDSSDNIAMRSGLIQSVLASVGNLVADSVLPGQTATQFSLSEFRMSVQLIDSENDEKESRNLTMPVSGLESLIGKSPTTMQLPSTNTSTNGTVRVIATSMRSALYSDLDTAVNSNPVTLFSSTPLCASSPCNVDFVLQNSHSIDFSSLDSMYGNTTVNTTCALGEHSVTNFTCPNGQIATLQCNGLPGLIFQQCPVVQYYTACDLLHTETSAVLMSGDSSGCRVKSFTDTEVVCTCDVLYGSTVSSHRVLSVSNYNFTEPIGYTVSYVAMLHSTMNSFASTISTADNLNASTVSTGWRAMATVGALAIAIVLGLFWGHHSDRRAKLVKPTPEEKALKPSTELTTTIMPTGKDKKRKVKFNFKKKALINAEMAIVEDSLPRALSSRTFSDRFLEEVKQHHRWFGIIFYYSDAFPRSLRVVSLATNAIVMLFIQSITYNLMNPDDGSCDVLMSEQDCMQPKSPFATGESKCSWISSADHQSSNFHTTATADGSCVYIEPDQSVRIILFVAIFCAIVTTPIALGADWMIGHILAAPTKLEVDTEETQEVIAATSTAASAGVILLDRNHIQNKANLQLNDSLTPIVPTNNDNLRKSLKKQTSTLLKNYIGAFSDTEKVKEDQATLSACKVELLMLSLQLRKYRDKLPLDQLEEFNLLWGLDKEGKFLTKTADGRADLLSRMKALFSKKEDVNVKEAVLLDLKRIHEAVRMEASCLKSMKASKHEIGKKLLFLFQCDLLPGISGKILDLKGSRDKTKVKHVSWQTKMIGWTALLLVDLAMLFYILLFALTQTGSRQNAWFQSFALWLVLEILLVSTAIVFITHILVPSLIMKDLSQIKRRLMDNIRDFNDKVQENKPNPHETISAVDIANPNTDFNAANFLFVSTRLARQFPNLKESKIIAQFNTPWPRQSYLRVQNVSKKYSKKFSAFTRSASILLIFFVGNFLSVPPACQDIIVQMTSTTAIGYLVLVHVQLFEIFPALVILPGLVLLSIVHFITQSSKADAQLKLARLFPSNRKKPTTATSLAIDAAHGSSQPAEVTADVESKESDEDILSALDSDDEFGDSPIVIRVPNAAQHKTRRQSISAGLDAIHALQDRVRRGEAVYEASEYSELTISSEDSKDTESGDDDQQQLHMPAGVRTSIHRVLSRGISMARMNSKSRASDYSVELSIPDNDGISDSDGESETSSGSESSSYTETNDEDDHSSTSTSVSESKEETSIGEDNDALGELVTVNKASRAYSLSVSTISNEIPVHLQSDSNHHSSASSSSCAEEFLPPASDKMSHTPTVPALVLHHSMNYDRNRDTHSSGDGSSVETSSSSSSSCDQDSFSDLSASIIPNKTHRTHINTEELAPVQIVYNPENYVPISTNKFIPYVTVDQVDATLLHRNTSEHQPKTGQGKSQKSAENRSISGSEYSRDSKNSYGNSLTNSNHVCSNSNNSNNNPLIRSSSSSHPSSDGIGIPVTYCALSENQGDTPLSRTPPRSADRNTEVSNGTSQQQDGLVISALGRENAPHSVETDTSSNMRSEEGERSGESESDDADSTDSSFDEDLN